MNSVNLMSVKVMHDCIVIVNPQCQLQAQESVIWCPEELCTIHRCDAFNTNFGHFVQYTSLSKKVFGIFLYYPQGKLQAQEGVIKRSQDPQF